MCGRLRVGKSFLLRMQGWSVQPCVRPVSAVHVSADASRPHSTAAGLLADVGCSNGLKGAKSAQLSQARQLAMPFSSPGSLSDDQVYGVVAYTLSEAHIIKPTVAFVKFEIL